MNSRCRSDRSTTWRPLVVSRSIRRTVLALVLLAPALIKGVATAQVSAIPKTIPFWDDTLSESPIYPVGDAIPVYRAVLDLLYLDGDQRPPVIIMHDSAEGHMGGPCPFPKCPGSNHVWTHKSKMDTSTVIAYARQTRKRPGIQPFGYPIPIVFISYDDVKRMEADGRELLAQNPAPPDLPNPSWGFWAELKRKYPGMWGVTTLSKVGFNKRHTEALVQAHQWCSDDCRIHETLFLRKSAGKWRVVERIPEEVEPGRSPDGRYLGPTGTKPSESELVPAALPGTPSEATARAGVYRAVLDSLYTVGTGGAQRIVLTNWFNPFGTLPAHTSALDSALVKRFAFLRNIRAPLDIPLRYRVPISILPVDSVPALRTRGAKLDAVPQTGFPFWMAFKEKYPGAWGMLGVSRIAFNPDRSAALVYTYHACGDACFNVDTWYLTRAANAWQIAERMPGTTSNTVGVEPLRYLGLDADPRAASRRRVRGVVTDPSNNNQPIKRFEIFVRRMLNSGVMVNDPSLMTDSLGRFTLTNLPLDAGVTLVFRCPNRNNDLTDYVPIAVRAGLDTTINRGFPLSECYKLRVP